MRYLQVWNFCMQRNTNTSNSNNNNESSIHINESHHSQINNFGKYFYSKAKCVIYLFLEKKKSFVLLRNQIGLNEENCRLFVIHTITAKEFLISKEDPSKCAAYNNHATTNGF